MTRVEHEGDLYCRICNEFVINRADVPLVERVVNESVDLAAIEEAQPLTVQNEERQIRKKASMLVACMRQSGVYGELVQVNGSEEKVYFYCRDHGRMFEHVADYTRLLQTDLEHFAHGRYAPQHTARVPIRVQEANSNMRAHHASVSSDTDSDGDGSIGYAENILEADNVSVSSDRSQDFGQSSGEDHVANIPSSQKKPKPRFFPRRYRQYHEATVTQPPLDIPSILLAWYTKATAPFTVTEDGNEVQKTNSFDAHIKRWSSKYGYSTLYITLLQCSPTLASYHYDAWEWENKGIRGHIGTFGFSKAALYKKILEEAKANLKEFLRAKNEVEGQNILVESYDSEQVIAGLAPYSFFFSKIYDLRPEYLETIIIKNDKSWVNYLFPFSARTNTFVAGGLSLGMLIGTAMAIYAETDGFGVNKSHGGKPNPAPSPPGPPSPPNPPPSPPNPPPSPPNPPPSPPNPPPSPPNPPPSPPNPPPPGPTPPPPPSNIACVQGLASQQCYNNTPVITGLNSSIGQDYITTGRYAELCPGDASLDRSANHTWKWLGGCYNNNANLTRMYQNLSTPLRNIVDWLSPTPAPSPPPGPGPTPPSPPPPVGPCLDPVPDTCGEYGVVIAALETAKGKGLETIAAYRGDCGQALYTWLVNICFATSPDQDELITIVTTDGLSLDSLIAFLTSHLSYSEQIAMYTFLRARRLYGPASAAVAALFR